MSSSLTQSPPQFLSSQFLLDQYRTVRAFSEKICEPLVPEDYVVQSMPDVSPAKWHLAHTSWFFETFLLKPHLAGYQSIHPQYDYPVQLLLQRHRRAALPGQARRRLASDRRRDLRVPGLCGQAYGHAAV